MKVLVTGGNGFIGSHLVKVLRERGDSVMVMDLPDDVLTAPLPTADFVYHLAAVARVGKSYEDPMRTAEVNVGGTLRILQEYAPTTDECGISQWVPVVVAGTLHKGSSPYAVTKAALVSMCSQFHNAKLIRFGNVYGGGEGVIDRWLREPEIVIYGAGQTCKDFIHVDDVVAGLLNPSSKPVSNLCTGRLMSLEELSSHYDKHVSYRSPQPGDWSTEKVTPDYPVKWTVEAYLRSKGA